MLTIFFYLAILFFFITHSVLVMPPVKHKALNYISSKNYRLFYNIFSILLLILILILYKEMDHKEFFSFKGQDIIGWSLIGIGSILSYISFKPYNTLEFLGLTDEDENEKLSVGGMNKYVRHPLYSTGLIILWGVLLVEPTYEYLGFAIITSLYIYIGTLLEEKKLIAKFGPAYISYKRQVPMLIPKTTYKLSK